MPKISIRHTGFDCGSHKLHQTYGMEAKTALDKANSLDSSNPRVLYLEASGALNTPEQYGGGKAKAKPLFVKALKLFKTFQHTLSFTPKLGQG